MKEKFGVYELEAKETTGVFWYPTNEAAVTICKTGEWLGDNTSFKPLMGEWVGGIVLFKHLQEAAFNGEAMNEGWKRYFLIKVNGVNLIRLPRPKDDALIDVMRPVMYTAGHGVIPMGKVEVLDVVSLKA